MLIDVVVIGVCAALAALGVVFVVRWGAGVTDAAADGEARRAHGRLLVRLARDAALLFAAGVAAGLMAGGAAGRLVMGLLALTSPDGHGMITEGGATVGQVTVEGTISLVTFVGVTSGALSACVYALAGSLLPRGRAGGVTLGLFLLVLVGAQVDPLRADNIDFNLVGPDWLSLLGFAAVAVFQGMLMWALAGRLGVRPLPVGRSLGGTRAVTAGRLAAGALVLVMLPGFLAAVADILRVG